MIKKAFNLILVLLIISSSFTIVYSEDKSNQNYSPKSMLILGDSISTGYGLENYSTDKTKTTSYGNLLAKKYSLKSSYVNMAIDGMTSDDLLTKLKQKEYDNYIKKSEVIIVSIGGNDVLGTLLDTIITTLGLPKNASYSDINSIDFNNPDVAKKLIAFLTSNQYTTLKTKIVSEFNANFFAITRYIYLKNPQAKVIYQNVYNPFSGVENYSLIESIIENIITNLNKIISSNSSIQKDGQVINLYRFIDVYKTFKSKSSEFTNILSNDIHPNKNGHKIIFELCDNAILKFNEILSETIKNEVTLIEAKTELPLITQSKITKSDEPKEATNTKLIFVIAWVGGLIGLGFIVIIIRKQKNDMAKKFLK